ncbi:MAG: YceI family protein [Chloroflexota bacterium]
MLKRIVTIGVVAVALVASIFVYSTLRAPAAPSETIEAIPLPSEEAASSSPSAAPAATSDTQSSAAESAAATDAQAESAQTTFEIVPAESEVRFELDEDLRGQRKTVVGTTDQVAGQIALDLSNLDNTQVGVIQVNARTLTTDNQMRNRTLQNRILDTSSYEYITFTPTSVAGLPDSAAVGDTITFSIIGDLTIRDVTQEVAFTVEATLISASELSGTATATVLRDDFNLVIPSVPQVANVEEEVELIIDFVAEAL